ncbi:MAG TPA: hypothetical protein VFI65_18110 [Streptosporangiaceae bacterium]|nr:hypothetical protein [Streptosporangiaceae bacterium]
MRLTFVKGTVVGAITAMACLTATSALAGTGVGAVFNLGRTNSVNATSNLKGSVKGPMLAVTNSKGPALNLAVPNGKSPLTVNSSGRVQHLNASLLDGHHATDFMAGGGQARSFGFLSGPGQKGTLLTIPGYGQFTTMCTAGVGAEIFFDVGSHDVELVAEQQDNNFSPAQVFRKALTAKGGFSFLIAGGSASEIWDQVLLRYGTVSSPTSKVTEHVAAVSVFYSQVDSNTCDFNASVTAPTGSKSP